jgi:hypothetical protein
MITGGNNKGRVGTIISREKHMVDELEKGYLTCLGIF